MILSLILGWYWYYTIKTMDQNVIFQQQNNIPNTSKQDRLDPFAKYETAEKNSPSSIQQQSSSIPSFQKPPVVSSQSFPQNSAVAPSINAIPSQPSSIVPPGPPPPPSFFSGIPFWAKIAGGVTGGIFLLFIIIIFVSRSHGGTKSNPNVTLEYWQLWEDKQTLNQLFADFHKQYPYITVNVIKEDPKYYSDRLMTRIKGG